MKNLLLILALIPLSIRCTPPGNINSAEETILISEIASQTEEQVSGVLGQSSSSEESKYGPKHYYQDGRFEIVYINGKADWITINENWEDIDLSETESYVSVDTFENYIYIKVATM